MTKVNEVKRVTIPREVAEGIEYLREVGWTDDDILNESAYRAASHTQTLVRRYFIDNRVTFASAIINGYSVEKSAEELAHDRIREKYRLYSATILVEDYGRELYMAESGMAALLFVLNELNVKITEVNA